MMRKSRRWSSLTAGAVLALLALAQPANAAPHPHRAFDDSALRQHKSSLGMHAEVQGRLIVKLEAGQPVDDMTDSAPVSTQVRIKDGYSVSIDTYADGSVGETGNEIGRPATPDEVMMMQARARSLASPYYHGDPVDHEDLIQPDATVGITSCVRGRNAGVVYAQNCHVHYNGVTASNSFNANYQQHPGGGKAQYIDGTAEFVSFVQSVDDEHVDVYDNGSRIRCSFSTSLNGFGNIPGFLQLKVTGTGAYVSRG
jgi:hypothetical protein